MRDNYQLPVDLKQRALETFGLELLAGVGQDSAVINAVSATLEAFHRQITDEIADLAIKYAEDMDEYTDGVNVKPSPDTDTLVDDGAAALLWFAKKLKEDLPLTGDYDYVPKNGDEVEISFRGSVWTTADDKYWYVQPDNGYTENVTFDRSKPDGPRVRLLYREE